SDRSSLGARGLGSRSFRENTGASSIVIAMVIAIDGPAGAGKSAGAGEVAERVVIELGERVLLDGRDVTEEIRTPAASEAASQVASDPAVRAALVRKQQAIVAEGHWVAEGRDIATVVAPDAAVKVFLTADPEERARRRATDLGQPVEEVLKAQQERDARDHTGDRFTLEAP